MLFAIVLGRVALLQTLQSDDLRATGRAQRTTETLLKATRGTMFDRNGNDLAVSIPTSTLIANPKLVLDAPGTARALATLLALAPEKEDSLAAAFAARDRSFVYVARQVDDELAASVSALDLPGIDVLREDKRIMPSGEVGRSVIGRTDIDGVGTAGLELQFDELLTGIDGERIREHDRDGRSIAGTGATTTEPTPGDDLVLTLDRSLQYQVEQALVGRVETLLAKGGTAIVMDSRTGEIYAIANVRRDDEGIVSVTSANMAAVDAYEPGSVAKVFSIAGAIDSGAVDPDTVLEVPYRMTFDEDTDYEYTITDAYQHPTEPMSVRDIFVRSSNVGTLMTGARLGATGLGAYLESFGFGATTGLGFPSESAGIFNPASEWRGTEKATHSYGYGMSTTALQLIAAVNVVANGGEYVAPKLVMASIDATGEVVMAPEAERRRVIAPNTATIMTAMMRDVVCDDRGTGELARIPDISVAGKTGTGYKRQDNGTYLTDEGTHAYFASFVGFFPAADPRVTILVSIDEPNPETQDRYGGTAAAPVFVEIARSAIHEMQITPTPGDVGCGPTGSP